MNITAVFFKPFGMDYKERQAAIARCKSQNERVMLIFKEKGVPLTPYDVFRIYVKWFPKNICKEGSIRRSITDLTTHGMLSMTGNLKPGGWGAQNHLWRIADKVLSD